MQWNGNLVNEARAQSLDNSPRSVVVWVTRPSGNSNVLCIADTKVDVANIQAVGAQDPEK